VQRGPLRPPARSAGKGKENSASLGQLDGASLSNCRELRAEGGVNTKLTLHPVKKHYFLSKRYCLAGDQCERSGTQRAFWLLCRSVQGGQ
jgi:hypothetical protein